MAMIRSARRMIAPTSGGAPTPSGPDVRDWIRSTSPAHREALRQQLLEDPRGVDPFVLDYISNHPDNTNRTVATALMQREAATQQEAA